MASKETLGRIRHINLTTQQRRLRHLHSVSARNIVPSFQLSGDSLVECLLETFFTLHTLDTSSPAIYTSEKIPYSLNPTWASFELNTLNDCLQTSTSSNIIRLWGGERASYRLILEWKVDLKLLQYLGDQIRTAHHPPNTLIFGLVDGYYGAPVTTNPAPKITDAASPINVISSIKVEMDQVAPSYSKASFHRLSSLQRAIRQTQISVLEYQHLIENRLITTEKSMLQLAKREFLRLKVKILREELICKVGVVNKEREEEKKMLQTIRKRERNLAKKRKLFEEKNLLLIEHKQLHVDKRENLVKLNAQLNMRKRQLACELTHIYPMTTVVRGPAEHGIEEYYICNVRLPNSESNEFFSTDDETLSCSLGYTCHLVYMISKIMEIPLRYAMNPMGSRSTIMNYTIEKVAEKDKEFPLYTKGKEKIQFYYGIFLLNKNIAQLRQYYNLGTPNLRKTLPNLKDTLVKRFQASSEQLKSTSMNDQASFKPHIDTKSNDSLKTTIDDVINENTTSTLITKPPLMPKPADSTSTSPTKPPLMPKPADSTSTSPTKPPLMPKRAGSTSNASPTKPPLMPKRAGSTSNASATKPPLMPKRGGSSSVDGHPGISTSPTKPPLPPKPHNLSRNTKDKLENDELLAMVNIRYDVTSEHDTSQRREDLQEQILDSPRKITGLENNGTIMPSVEAAAIQPPPQGATHKFFEKRAKKKSITELVAQENELTKSEKNKKRKSLQDIRGVPVEVMRERAAALQELNKQRKQLERHSAESDVRSGSKSENPSVFNDMSHSVDSTTRTNSSHLSEQISRDDNNALSSTTQHDELQLI